MTSGYLEHRPCNRCVIEAIQVLADTHDGTVIEVKQPKPGFPDGVGVYVRYPGDADKTFVAWFGKIPDRCEC
jgi:hypothetical protein